MSTAAPTIRSLDARVDDLEKEFRQFIAEMRLVVTLLKWVAGFSAATFLALIIQLFSISFSAGQLKQKVDDQAVATEKMQGKVEKMQEKVDVLATSMVKLQEKMDGLATSIGKIQEKVDALAIATGKLQERSDAQTKALLELKSALPKP